MLATCRPLRNSHIPVLEHARFPLQVAPLLGGQYAAGMDQFLAVLKADRKFNEDLGRRALLDAFKVVPDADLIGDYRRKMTRLLF